MSLKKIEGAITLTQLKCFNCKTSPVYYKDTSMGVDCSDCADGDMCDGCAEDLEFPHVVAHEETGCPFGLYARHTTKSKAVALWRDDQERRRRKGTL